MKKVIMTTIGGLLFIAGYNYIHRQAEYTATQATPVKTVVTKTPGISFFKIIPAFVFRTNKTAFSTYHL